MSASPAEATPPAGEARKVLVWDAPVRVFHWLTVASFAGAYLTAESERWRLLHVTLGYTLGGLVAFRVIWGFVGTRNARFSSFVRGPRAVLRYLKAMGSDHPEHHTGHNPAGAMAIMAMLALALAVTASGWAVFNDIGGERLAGLHEFAANTMLAVIGVHVAGVLFASWLGHENLIGAMFTGRKDGRPEEGVRSAWRTVAVLMLIAVATFWWTQWQAAPASGGPAGALAVVQAPAQADARTAGRARSGDRDGD
jgi:cytochrome b